MTKLDIDTLLYVISSIERQIDSFPHLYSEAGVGINSDIHTGHNLALNDLKDYLQSYIENEVNKLESQ